MGSRLYRGGTEKTNRQKIKKKTTPFLFSIHIVPVLADSEIRILSGRRLGSSIVPQYGRPELRLCGFHAKRARGVFLFCKCLRYNEKLGVNDVVKVERTGGEREFRSFDGKKMPGSSRLDPVTDG
ncbi:MAG: hypothetical protein GTN81_08400 [Proteobacteria bacterium]|nr:hypothetical protein [Pseudomonadota bacterium]